MIGPISQFWAVIVWSDQAAGGGAAGLGGGVGVGTVSGGTEGVPTPVGVGLIPPLLPHADSMILNSIADKLPLCFPPMQRSYAGFY